MELTPEQQKIWDKRAKEYGDGILNHENVGLMWTGILQCYFQTKLPHQIPGYIVSLMMAAIKISRAAEGVYKEDDYVDAGIYMCMAEKGRTK